MMRASRDGEEQRMKQQYGDQGKPQGKERGKTCWEQTKNWIRGWVLCKVGEERSNELGRLATRDKLQEGK